MLPAQADQVRPFLVGGGAEDRGPRRQLLRDGRPVHLVESGTIAPDHDDLFVPLRKRIGYGVREARSEFISPLTGVRKFENREVAVCHGLPGMLVERSGHLAVRRDILLHELLVLPLPLGTVAEEQEGGMGAVCFNNRTLGVRRGRWSSKQRLW